MKPETSFDESLGTKKITQALEEQLLLGLIPFPPVPPWKWGEMLFCWSPIAFLPIRFFLPFHQVTLEVVQSSPPREHLQQLPLKQFHPKRSHGAIEVNLASPYATLCCLTGRCLVNSDGPYGHKMSPPKVMRNHQPKKGPTWAPSPIISVRLLLH